METLLNNVFPDREIDENLIQVFRIYKNAMSQLYNSANNFVHRHHIIPRAWFKHNHLKPINTKQNIINLTINDHVTVHYYLMKYFKNKNEYLYLSMLYAVVLLLKKTRTIDEIIYSSTLTNLKIDETELNKLYQIRYNTGAKILKNWLAHTTIEDRRKMTENGRKVAKQNWNKLSAAERSQIMKDRHKKISDDTKKRMREKSKIAMKEIWRNLSLEQRQRWIMNNSSESRSQVSKNRIWVSNKQIKEQAFIKQDELEFYLKQGYTKGRLSFIRRPVEITIHHAKLKLEKRILHNEFDSYYKLGWRMGSLDKIKRAALNQRLKRQNKSGS